MATKDEKKLLNKQAEDQLLIEIRKDTLAREAALDQITLSKIKDKWFEILIDTKVPQMQDNLKHILHYMEKLIEAENFRKLLFEDEIQELEEKSTFQAKSHGSALETLFDIYQKRIQYLNNAFHEMVSEKKAEAEAEFKMIDDQENKSQVNMNMILFQMQENKEKVEDIMKYDMHRKINEEQSKNGELVESLQTKLKKKMESRWGEITDILNTYEETTQARTKHCIKLKIRDDMDSKIIYQQMKKIQKLFEQLDEVKNCSEECYAPKDKITSLNDLREERMKFFNIFKQFKSKLTEELKEDEMKLKTLTVISNELTNNMTKTCSKGEQILTMFRVCRKFETDYEKVIPVGNPLDTAKLGLPTQKRKTIKYKKQKEEGTENQKSDKKIKDTDIFEKFWRKASKVRLSILALEKCINSAKKKNQLLKRVLALYFNEVAKTNIQNSVL